LTHWDSSGIINWIACPKCRTFFEFGKEIPIPEGEKDNPEFWKNVENDTGFTSENLEKK
jgi:hypothetical protein